MTVSTEPESTDPGVAPPPDGASPESIALAPRGHPADARSIASGSATDAGCSTRYRWIQAEIPLSGEWRAEAARAQERALPAGQVTVSCAASLGVAGLGRHAREIVDALERRGAGSSVYVPAPPGTAQMALRRRRPLRRLLAGAPGPLWRLAPARRVNRAWAEFDAYAAERLLRAEHLLAFSGQALSQFGVAYERGYRSRGLVCGSVHVRRLAHRHEAAHRRYPLERANARHASERQLLEYAWAQRIYVSSAYTWESFAEQGVAAEVLVRFPLTPHPRFRPPDGALGAETFDVVYVGGLAVAKGVPLLIDAVRRLPYRDLRLVLVGGSKSRGMRRFIECAQAADPRIGVLAGDPLPHLQRARLCAHPSYTDGFAYGAAEALACGVPVLVSEDTGMKELIEPGRTGMVLPTGDLEALAEAIDAAYRGELLGG